jgi:hypothetical protein
LIGNFCQILAALACRLQKRGFISLTFEMPPHRCGVEVLSFTG